MDDYSKMPESIGELKAERTHDGSQWAPRDVLIHILRMIDSGQVKPQTMIVSYLYEDGDGRSHAYATSAPGAFEAIATAQRTVYKLNRQMD